MLPDNSEYVSLILNAAWMVRHYRRGRSGYGALLRAQAVLRLGLTIREAFNATDDFEALLAAVVDGLRPADPPPF